MSLDLLAPLRHPHFNIVKASCQRLISQLKAVKENRDEWKAMCENSNQLRSETEAELASTLEKLSKTDAKVVSHSKKNTQLEVLLQSETQEKNAARREREAKETELSASIAQNMALRADVRRLQMDLEIATDKIIILEQVSTFQDTKSMAMQKSVESLLATMSGHEAHGPRQSDPTEQNAT